MPQEAATKFIRAACADWVERIPLPADGDADSATAWLLVDEQFNLRRPVRRFYRQVHRANNESGAEMLSEIRIQFNPSYETLTLHGVSVTRHGQTFDALEDADIDFLRVEHDMYARVYRGDYLVIVQVRGLEPNDVIDYAYTIEGANPALGERHCWVASHTFSLPVTRRFFRVLMDTEGEAPELMSRGPELALKQIQHDDHVELRADIHGLPPADVEYWAPAEFDTQTSLTTFSSFRTWQDVAAWARELYDLPADDPTVVELAERFTAQEALSPEIAAIAYVQERIRYVSTSFGGGGYRPRRPETIATRRYGDCKDKSLLLAALLRRMGHKADVALVNSLNPRGPLSAAPTPMAFNHVIVRAQIDGETYWIDATNNGQRGPLSVRGRPHSMAALLIRADSDAPLLIPALPAALVGDRSEGTIDLRDGPGRAALCDSTATSVGIDAESVRRALAVNGLVGLRQMYEDAQSQDHGEVEHEVFEIDDDEATNTITLRQRLRLGDPWRQSPQGGVSFRSTLCYATTLLPPVPANGRKFPLSVLDFPLHHVHAETILLPRGWRLRNEASASAKRANTAFAFERRQSLHGDRLRVEVETKTLAPYLPGSEVLAALRDQTALQEAHVLDLQFRRGSRLFGS